MAKNNVPLTYERLKEVIHYNRQTGVFRWKVFKGATAPQGREAGSLSSDTGYRLIRVDGRLYGAHRLAWFYTSGTWPIHQIDHINGNRADNRLENLRQATVSENRVNRPMPASNRVGLKGVSRNPPGWMARIKMNGVVHHLGTFPTPEEAHAAYCTAAALIHGEFARTN